MTEKNYHGVPSKKIILEVQDKIYTDLSRLARADRRKLNDLVMYLLCIGLDYAYIENNLPINKLESEYTEDEKNSMKIGNYVPKTVDKDKFITELILSLENQLLKDN